MDDSKDQTLASRAGVAPRFWPSGWQKLDLETGTKAAALTTALLYAIGLVVTNLYLFNLGVSDFAVLRVRFVLIGLNAVGHAVAFVAIIFVFLELVGDLLHRSLGSVFPSIDTARLKRLVHFPLYAVPMAYLFLISNYWPDSFILKASLWVCLAVLLFVPRLLIRGNAGSLLRQPVVSFIITLLAIALLGYFSLGLYTRTFFPLIPEQFGGARPKMVQFFFAPDAAQSVREIGIVVAEPGLISERQSLLWEGEQTYIIRLPEAQGGAVVQIDKDLVGAIVLNSPLDSPIPPAAASPVAIP